MSKQARPQALVSALKEFVASWPINKQAGNQQCMVCRHYFGRSVCFKGPWFSRLFHAWCLPEDMLLPLSWCLAVSIKQGGKIEGMKRNKATLMKTPSLQILPHLIYWAKSTTSCTQWSRGYSFHSLDDNVVIATSAKERERENISIMFFKLYLKKLPDIWPQWILPTPNNSTWFRAFEEMAKCF